MEDFIENEPEPSVPGETGMVGLLLQLAKEFKIPVSVALMAVMLVTEAYLMWDHVSRADIKDVHREMEIMAKSIDTISATFSFKLTGVQAQLAFDHLDNRKHAVRTEMFNLKQKLKESGKDDRMSEQRLDELEGEEQELDRQLNNLHIPTE